MNALFAALGFDQWLPLRLDDDEDVAGVLAYVPTLVGILLAIAGFGYAIDSFGAVLVADYSLQVAIVTFVGEIVLIGWLLLRGRRVSVDAEDATLST